jgi:hypothetical protein
MNWRLRLAVVAFTLAILLPTVHRAFAQSDKKPTIAELLQRLESAEGPGRDRLMEQLDQIHDADVLVPAVLAALDRVDPENAWKLLDVLARFPGAHAEAPLVRLAQRADQIPRGMEPFLTGEPARNELLKALADVCASWKPPSKNLDEATVDELTAEDQGALKSQRLIEWIGDALGQTGSSGLDQLLAMLRDHSGCRESAAQAGLTFNILQSAELDPRMVNGVTAALSDPDAHVQHSAVAVLEPMIGYDKATLSKEMLQPLFAILKSSPEFDARRAAFALLKRAPGDTAKKAVELASHDPDGNLQRYAEEFLDQLSAATPDENP